MRHAYEPSGRYKRGWEKGYVDVLGVHRINESECGCDRVARHPIAFHNLKGAGSLEQTYKAIMEP